MRKRPIRAAFTALLLLPAACGTTDPNIAADGVVRFIDVEGGCWVIDTADARLEPINLASEFQVDGLDVLFEATERTDLTTICQVGQIVELESIEAAG